MMIKSKEKIGGRDWVKIIDAMAAAITANQDELTSLDAIVGDGDHGVNMVAAMTTACRAGSAITIALAGGCLAANWYRNDE